jgi:hypothetical protein
VLTATDPTLVLRGLAEAFDGFGHEASSAHSRASGNPADHRDAAA